MGQTQGYLVDWNSNLQNQSKVGCGSDGAGGEENYASEKISSEICVDAVVEEGNIRDGVILDMLQAAG